MNIRNLYRLVSSLITPNSSINMSNSTSSQKFITLDRLGPDIQVPFRYSTKAKRIAIRITHTNPELILPNKNFDAGYKFLLSKESWIRKKLQHIATKVDINPHYIPIFDDIFLLKYIDGDQDKVYFQDEIIQIYSKNSNHHKTLMKFLYERLLEEITKSASFLSIKYGLKFSKIRIMQSKNKWGSCSSKAVISFNWRLIFAPRNILEYLIVHEMCHLKEMNHSKRFWDLVQKLYPDYKLAKLWLKENRVRLHQYLSLLSSL